MNLKRKISLAANLLECSLIKHKKPLFVGWRVTNRCNLRCKYCKLPENRNELSTKEVFSVIDELARMGCKRINYTGGEPLLRKDIGKIIDHTKSKGIYASLNTNGTLLSKKIDQISNIDRITISLDGPEVLNRITRKRGIAPGIINLIQHLKRKGIKVNISCVLTKYNVNHIDEIMGFIGKADVYIYFQPVTDYFYSWDKVKENFPKKREYDKAIETLINMKKHNLKIGNSMSGLKHLSFWPNEKKINCAAGIIRCRIEANGDVYPCNRIKNKEEYTNLRKVGIKKAFEEMVMPKCDGCWCANHVEMNLIYSLRPDAIYNSFRIQV